MHTNARPETVRNQPRVVDLSSIPQTVEHPPWKYVSPWFAVWTARVRHDFALDNARSTAQARRSIVELADQRFNDLDTRAGSPVRGVRNPKGRRHSTARPGRRRLAGTHLPGLGA